ncbi:hypothetical protein [Bacillus sp. B1-b2]|uniref:hypothetical protein n=1 Tax=Bacillus sp. B1-b2 TaxID=2653201 RepID=UPI0012622D8C|nr:hypothetical protein [Bacillus sp. B1-b2]KAB7672034.1 hypothetical protein F9279_03670 [Bacillus sp. B1-b2]
MNNRTSFIYAILFLFLPVIYLISFFSIKYIIQQGDLKVIATDCFSILGIYYILISLVFSFKLKKIKLKDM